mgnify:CR=1 FL=1
MFLGLLAGFTALTTAIVEVIKKSGGNKKYKIVFLLGANDSGFKPGDENYSIKGYTCNLGNQKDKRK